VVGGVVPALRAFHQCAVRYLVAEAGIRQFLDIGTRLTMTGNTHEVAQSLAPDCRIVYASSDPVVLSHARALATSTTDGAVAALDADPHYPRGAWVPVRRWNAMSDRQMTLRSRGELARLLAGLDLVPPGLVPITEWHPEAADPRFEYAVPVYGAVGRKS
jgi:hypothetical protein